MAVATALVAAFATAGSAAPSPPPAPEAHLVKPLRGTCDIAPVGKQVITAELALTLPTSVPVGTPIRPKDVTLKLAFAADTVKALLDKQITSIDGIAGVRLKAGKTELPARGPIPKTPLTNPPPETSGLTVELPATVTAAIQTRKPGQVTFTLGALELLLAQVRALDEPTGEAAPVVCVPDENQDTALASVSVLAPPKPGTTEPGTTEPGTTPSTPGTSTSAPPKIPTSSGKPDTKPAKPKARDEPEPCSGEIPPEPISYSFWSYYPLDGHVEVHKFKSGIDFGPGWMSAQLFFWYDGEIACGAIEGELMWRAAHGSFVAFQFLPTTADVTVVQVGKAEGRLNNGVFKGIAKVHQVLSNTKVQGTPLPVGPHCQTAEPIVINLASTPEQWDPLVGGTMEAEMTIPPMAGCGVTEDLDPLLTGLISGPKNHLKLVFGNVVICEPPNEPCVPPLPPVRR